MERRLHPVAFILNTAHQNTEDSTGCNNSRPVADCSPWPSYLRQARWMTVAALFFLRNSSFLLRSLWIICRRCSTGRRWIFTFCPGGGPWTTSLSGDARASSHSFLHPDLNSSVRSGRSEETPPTSLSGVTLFLGVR